MEHGAVIIEGGAFRGLYATGVLDVFLENQIVFDTTIGVSAGVMCATSYLSQQIGRTRETNLALRSDHRYVGVQAMKNCGGVIDVGLPFEAPDVLARFPFDFNKFHDPARKLFATASDMQTGTPYYLERVPGENFTQAIRATTAMPILQPPVTIDSHRFLDGAVTDAVPYEWAMQQNFGKIVVILTRPLAFRRKPYGHAVMRAAKRRYGNTPAFIEAMAHQHEVCDASREKLARLAANGDVFVFEPSMTMNVGRLEPDVSKLALWMELADHDTRGRIDEFKEWLSD